MIVFNEPLDGEAIFRAVVSTEREKCSAERDQRAEALYAALQGIEALSKE